MGNFLTTRQVQDLIHVDRSTVYRMAEDGRLSAVKVGRQWRFPADRIAEQLGIDAAAGAPVSRDDSADLRRLLAPGAAQSVADLVADLFGVMAVVTDMEGRPITEVANPCGYYAAIAARPGARQACAEGWRRLGEDPELRSRFVPSHLGFLCARSFVRVGSRLVGMLIVGGVTPPEWPPPPELLHGLAAEVGLPGDALEGVVHDTYDVDEAMQQRILELLPRIGDLISQLASARSQLLDKLDAIAALAGPMARPERITS